jgi:hypothetical protein
MQYFNVAHLAYCRYSECHYADCRSAITEKLLELLFHSGVDLIKLFWHIFTQGFLKARPFYKCEQYLSH